MSIQPDWSKAPEGATHYHHALKLPWLRLKDGLPQFHSQDRGWMNYVSQIAGHVHIVEAVQRPAEQPSAWTGEGLPPVGTVCEVLNSDLHAAEWEACTVLFSGKHRVVYDSESCSERVGYIESLKFRPIRTPEQIAAEERNKAIMEMWNCLVTTSSKHILVQKQACAELYDAGYRKQDAQQHELQVSSDIHQANRELAEQRLRRLAEIEGQMNKMNGAVATQETAVVFFNLQEEKREILSHYREPQA